MCVCVVCVQSIVAHEQDACALEAYPLALLLGDCVSYNDLNRLEWLMHGKDDIQFDVYRDMWNVTL